LENSSPVAAQENCAPGEQGYFSLPLLPTPFTQDPTESKKVTRVVNVQEKPQSIQVRMGVICQQLTIIILSIKFKLIRNAYQTN
jgi:hypothetical protein